LGPDCQGKFSARSGRGAAPKPPADGLQEAHWHRFPAVFAQQTAIVIAARDMSMLTQSIACIAMSVEFARRQSRRGDLSGKASLRKARVLDIEAAHSAPHHLAVFSFIFRPFRGRRIGKGISLPWRAS